MKHTFEKSMSIVNDLVGFCHENGGGDFHVDVKKKEDGTYYHIGVKMETIKDTCLEEFRETLSIPRQREVEQMYWGTSSEMETHINLELIAIMLDEATIEYLDGEIVIDAFRAK